MGRDDKFDEHALPGFYVGPSPENPEEKYVAHVHDRDPPQGDFE